MKNYSWIVEVKNPMSTDDVLWKCVAETLEKVAKRWDDECKNNYLTYSRLHNIYHKRNIKDFNIISVKKVNECLEDCLESISDTVN
tara:strand:+ start:299 stop:556 length:258 start_codon:yes stop_codon:yes gene_type:complete